MTSDKEPTDVSRGSGPRRAGEIDLDKWDWVERSVWTIRMLKALEGGVKFAMALAGKVAFNVT